LPPIIFAAGYNLKKKEFFHNFKLIMFYGIFGTLIVFFIVSAFAIGFNEMDIFFSTKLHIS
jgi:NhaP-type Na+/H+ or K+/H+ antiporter